MTGLDLSLSIVLDNLKITEGSRCEDTKATGNLLNILKHDTTSEKFQPEQGPSLESSMCSVSSSNSSPPNNSTYGTTQPFLDKRQLDHQFSDTSFESELSYDNELVSSTPEMSLEEVLVILGLNNGHHPHSDEKLSVHGNQ